LHVANESMNILNHLYLADLKTLWSTL
jgi:hypothetical protein